MNASPDSFLTTGPLGADVLVERARHHFHRAGWKIEDPGDLAGWRADLILERRGSRKAVLVREEPPGPVALATFARECRRRGLRGIVVAPEDTVVQELCENAQLEFFPAEGLGEVPVLGRAPEPAPLPVERPVLPAPIAPAIPAARSTPWWRWAVVALIWGAALAVLAYDLSLVL